jgi:hypothetical protein
VTEIARERGTIDFGGHWWRVILLILLVGTLDGFVRAALFPSKEEFREMYEMTVRSGSTKYMTIAETAHYLQLLVFTQHFLLDAIFLIPAVVLRFFIVRRPLFRVRGIYLTIIVIAAFCGIFFFSGGSGVMGKNIGIFLVVYGMYRVLSSKRKR